MKDECESPGQQKGGSSQRNGVEAGMVIEPTVRAKVTG